MNVIFLSSSIVVIPEDLDYNVAVNAITFGYGKPFGTGTLYLDKNCFNLYKYDIIHKFDDKIFISDFITFNNAQRLIHNDVSKFFNVEEFEILLNYWKMKKNKEYTKKYLNIKYLSFLFENYIDYFKNALIKDVVE